MFLNYIFFFLIYNIKFTIPNVINIVKRDNILSFVFGLLTSSLSIYVIEKSENLLLVIVIGSRWLGNNN